MTKYQVLNPSGVPGTLGGIRCYVAELMIPILTYHRVGEGREAHVPTVGLARFERQMAFLARHRYQVIAIDAFAEALISGRALPRRGAMITFDDGYDDNAVNAAPILGRFGFPSTVFVSPLQIGTPGFMTWDQVRGAQAQGMTIGSHTLHHTYLPPLSEAQVKRELTESKQLIEQQIGRPVHWLSYPIGGYTPTITRLAEAAGYRAAFTTNRGVSKRTTDRFAVRRIKVTDRDAHPLVFAVKLSGWYDHFRSLKSPARG